MAFRASWNPEDLMVCNDMSGWSELKIDFSYKFWSVCCRCGLGCSRISKLFYILEYLKLLIFISLISNCLSGYQRIRLLMPPLR